LTPPRIFPLVREEENDCLRGPMRPFQLNSIILFSRFFSLYLCLGLFKGSWLVQLPFPKFTVHPNSPFFLAFTLMRCFRLLFTPPRWHLPFHQVSPPSLGFSIMSSTFPPGCLCAFELLPRFLSTCLTFFFSPTMVFGSPFTFQLYSGLALNSRVDFYRNAVDNL